MKTLVIFLAIALSAFAGYAQQITSHQQSNNFEYYSDGLQNAAIVNELPSDFPRLTISKTNSPAPGHLLLTVFSLTGLPSYIMVLDSLGEPLHYKKPPTAGIDLKMTPNGLYSYAEAIAIGESHSIAGRIVQNAKVINYLLDSDFNIIDSVQCKNGYLADIHEFLVLPNGNYLMLAYETVPIDMSKVVEGGDVNAYVIGTVIQELDRNKKCIFQWRSLDHLPLDHTYVKITNTSFEHTHANSYYLDADGNLLVSFTASCDIAKIDLVSGRILYHFGGKRNQFDITDDEVNAPMYFTNQHDIKRLPNGNFLFFDNGFGKAGLFSRAVEFEIDETNKTAKKVWDYRQQPDVCAFAMGSAQRLSNGNTLINWGMLFTGEHVTVTEVNPNNEVVFEASLPPGAYSYRGLKYELPACRPVADVYVEEAFEGNTYQFKNQKEDTGVELYITRLESFIYNMLKIRKYDCSPMNPEFEDETPILIPGRFHFSADFVYSIAGEMRFDITMLPARYDYRKMKVYHRRLSGNGVFREVPTAFDIHENILTAVIADSGEFVIGFVREEKQIDPPKLFKPADNALLLNSSKANLVWSPTGRYDSFDLQIAEDSDFSAIVIFSTNLSTTSLLADLPEGKEYYWRTRTHHKDVITNWSETRRFVFAPATLEINYPLAKDTLYKRATSIIRWTTNLSDSLSIRLLKGGNDILLVKDSLYSYNGGFAWRVPNSLTPGDDYSILISSIKEGGLEAISYEFSIYEPGTSVEERTISSKANMSILPNPSKGIVSINYNATESGKVHFKVYDIFCGAQSGAIIEQISEGDNIINLNLSHLQPGIYFCAASNGDSVVVEKIVIIK